MHFIKRLIAGFCTAALLAAGTAVSASAAEIYLGDVETDDRVDVADVIRLQKHLLGVMPLHYPQNIAADLNQDGAVNVFDLVLAKRAVLSGNWVLHEYEEELVTPPMPSQPDDTDNSGSAEPPPPASDDLMLSDGISIPAVLETGTPVIVRGLVTSEDSLLTSVTVGIYNTSGILISGMTAEPDALTFDLNLLDSGITFHRLAEGSYFYKVTASNASYQNVILDNQRFTVGDPQTLDPITLSEGTAIPASIAQGAVVIVRGTLSSGSVLTAVTAGIYDSAGNLVTGGTAEPDALTFDLHLLDDAITFNTLPAGNYTYRITAVNAGGSRIVEEQSFLVTE